VSLGEREKLALALWEPARDVLAEHRGAELGEIAARTAVARATGLDPTRIAALLETDRARLSAQAREVFEYWRERCRGGDPRVKFTADRRRKVTARLRDGYTLDYLKRAIDAAADAPTVVQGETHDDLEYVCRSGRVLEKHHARAEALAREDRSERRTMTKLLGQWDNEA
jgi:hypothetical protein